MELDPELTELFLQESSENIERLERELIQLEEHGGDAELLQSIFRAVHTIKGTSGFLGFRRLEAVSHAGEEVLALLRDGRIDATPAVTTALLALIDDIRASLGRIQATSAEGDDDHADTIARLGAISSGTAEPDVHAAPPREGAQESGTDGAPPPPPADRPVEHGVADTSVRLGIEVLDRILDLTGELGVLRARLNAALEAEPSIPVRAIYRDLRVVTSDLQDEVMRSRLQPVGIVTGRFPRVARDLAASLGKQVQVELSGEDVAVDRAINDALRDPLLHLVRNAVDHGLERPDERRDVGKNPVGHLSISATHSHGRVRVDVCDDGRGMDPARLRSRAVSTGQVSAEDAQQLSDREALDLAFLPGVSTSDQVTTVSGRGVGLDVVRSSLGTIGGRVEITSEPGRGVCFSVNAPLTLAILPVLTLTSGGHTYCLPQANIIEVRHIGADDSAVSHMDGVPIYHLRGHWLPLVELPVVLADAAGTGQHTAAVILEADHRRFALAVPTPGDTFDVVVKPMTPETRSIPVFSGVCILSDGEPALILDVAGIADTAGLTSEVEQVPEVSLPSAPEGESSVVLAAIPGGGSIAVRLRDVVRLEQFPQETVKVNGTSRAVMYGEEILPLLTLSQVLHERRGAPRSEPRPNVDELVPTIVCRASDRMFGLVVDAIEDVVPEPPTPAQPPSRAGVIASIYVRERFAELLDIERLAAEAAIGPSS